MSYRSFKRALGETSLERKCRFLFGACLLLLIMGSFMLYGKLTEQLVHEQARNKGRLLVDTIMTLTHWEALESNKEFSELVVKDLSEKLQREEYEWNFIRPSAAPGAPGQAQDEFERQVLADFLKAVPPTDPKQKSNTAPEFAERLLHDRSEYQYFQPIRAQETCLKVCHMPPPGGTGLDLSTAGLSLGMSSVDNRPLAEGDVMTVVRVQIPYRPTLDQLKWNRAILWSTGIVTVFLAMVVSYIIVRYVIVKPLTHLREVSDAISHGDITQRADIRTGDEFQALGVAFNRMLRHLIDTQQELRRVNDDLDAKVDELAQLNMRLYELNRLKSDFLTTMSHELRTPLNSILGFSEVLGSIDSLSDKQKRYVQNIQKSGKMLLDMINDILDLAKIESGKMELRLSQFRIDAVIAAQCDLVRPLTERKNIDLECRMEPNLPELHQDQSKVQQILNNLLSNAVKFTPEGGRIVVEATRDDEGRLELCVEDTGVGIAEEDQQAIFEKFRQGTIVLRSGDPLTREYSGTGLGLSIVKELCKLLGGEVTVRSQVGKGSRFVVRLPWRLPERPMPDGELLDGLHALAAAGRLSVERSPAVSSESPS